MERADDEPLSMALRWLRLRSETNEIPHLPQQRHDDRSAAER